MSFYIKMYKNLVFLRRLSYAAKSLSNTCKDPCLDLQQYLETPVFQENVFSPSIKSIMSANELFIPKPNHEIKVLARVSHPHAYPEHDLPEVAFLGRSNVGKSALLQALLKKASTVRARVSSKPGCTKILHFYQLGTKLCLVDMPGYGFNQPKWFEPLVNEYLFKRKNLLRLFLLIDGDVGLQESDQQVMLDLEHLKVPYALVMTKIDKSTGSKRLRNLLYLQSVQAKISSPCCFPQAFMLSSHTSEGLQYFMSFIAHISGNLNTEEQ